MAGRPGPVSRRRAVALGGLIASIGAAVALVTSPADDGPAPSVTAAPATATVERRTLVEREQLEGTLGFDDPRPVIHRSVSARPETVTWLAAEGSSVARGEPLYRVDGRPVALLYGRVPAYRTLRPGRRGADVRQLEANLVRLGFAPADMTVDGRHTQATAAAVQAWQRAKGIRPTGKVGPAEVVFLPGPRRIGRHAARVGAFVATGEGVLHTTGTRRVVRIALDAARHALVHRGDRVRVTLPNGRVVRGRIERVGRVARAEAGGAQAPGGDGAPVIDVTVAVPGGRRLGPLDEAPVTVAIRRRARRGVLAVPLIALLARPGGGYALEVAGRRQRLLAVRLGLAADGFVEVFGKGLSDGLRVVTAEL